MINLLFWVEVKSTSGKAYIDELTICHVSLIMDGLSVLMSLTCATTNASSNRQYHQVPVYVENIL